MGRLTSMGFIDRRHSFINSIVHDEFHGSGWHGNGMLLSHFPTCKLAISRRRLEHLQYIFDKGDSIDQKCHRSCENTEKSTLQDFFPKIIRFSTTKTNQCKLISHVQTYRVKNIIYLTYLMYIK